MQRESKNHNVYNIFKKWPLGKVMGLSPLCSVMSVSTLNLPLLTNLLVHQKQHWRAGKQMGETVCNLSMELCLKGRNNQCRWIAQQWRADPVRWTQYLPAPEAWENVLLLTILGILNRHDTFCLKFTDKQSKELQSLSRRQKRPSSVVQSGGYILL